MSRKFSSWSEIQSSAKVRISLNIVELVISATENNMLAVLMENEMLSAAYWLLGYEGDASVDYITAHLVTDVVPNQRGRQTTAFIALCVMMGYVKDLTKENQEAGMKRWKAGLASQNLPDLLDDTLKVAIWTQILNLKAKIYGLTDKREKLLKEYLRVKDDLAAYPPTMKAVCGQLNLVYDMAYLKSVVCMQDFINSGNPALLLLHVRKEAKEFLEVINEVHRREGAAFNTCRLMDNNKYPDLNHSKYPDLYAVTLQWARKTKRVQKNYLGSKSITDRSLDMDMARHLITMRGATKVPEPTEEDKRWLETVGCSTRIEEIRKLLGGQKTTKRRRPESGTDSDSDMSDSGEDTEAPTASRRSSGKKRRH